MDHVESLGVLMIDSFNEHVFTCQNWKYSAFAKETFLSIDDDNLKKFALE